MLQKLIILKLRNERICEMNSRYNAICDKKKNGDAFLQSFKG